MCINQQIYPLLLLDIESIRSKIRGIEVSDLQILEAIREVIDKKIEEIENPGRIRG